MGGQAKPNLQSANIQNPATTQQATDAYGHTEQGLAQQQNFINAVNAQNGLGHQTDVYNQLQGVANGTGPNPAMAALNQATAANTANQAALMAGQRGSSANPALIARQAAMQGGANQQAAVGQGATMQAQQSLNAINAAGGMANQMAGQQANAITGYNQAAQGQQSNVLNAIGQQNASNVAMQSNINNANAGVAQGNAGRAQDVAGGLFGGAAVATKLLPAAAMAAHGGMIQAPQMYADGTPNGPIVAAPPRSMDWNAHLSGGYGGVSAPRAPAAPAVEEQDSESSNKGALGGKAIGAAVGSLGKAAVDEAVGFAKGGKVPALLSPGEAYLAPDKVEKVAKSKDKAQAIKKNEEKIPGKAKVKGDSLKNDIVPKNLEEGGIVIPRSVMTSKDPAKEAAKFVSAVLGRQQGLRK